MSRILVAIDFEPASTAALEIAKELASRYGDEVVLVHAYELPVYSYPGLEPTLLPGIHVEVSQAARRALGDFASEHGGLRNIVVPGDPADEIVAAAKSIGARFIVMGTHGRRGLSHLLVGSVAERVLRKSPCPVLVVPHLEPKPLAA